MEKNDFQPWLDYFDMLRSYEQKGYLEVLPEKHEAYITRAALSTLSDYSGLNQLANGIINTAKHIRAYAGWMCQQGNDYLQHPFALHVVKEEHPHDLVYTLLLTRQRKWYCFWRMKDCIEVITYTKEK